MAAQLSRGKTAVAMATFKQKKNLPGNPDLALQWLLPPKQDTLAYSFQTTGLLKCLS